MFVFIPRTSQSRGERGYACLIRCVGDNPTSLAFKGRHLRCGIRIEESDLVPGDEWPVTPLLLEFAGNDHDASLQRLSSGWGGKRRPQIHVLWRYEGGGNWRQLARVSSVDNDWVGHFVAIARVEFERGGRTASAGEIAMRASDRWIEALDRELGELENAERVIALGLVYDQVTARVVDLNEVAA